MSWSVQANGKPGPVLLKLKDDFAKITYLGAEEANVKNAVAIVVEQAVSTQTAPVHVEANGSYSVKEGHFINLKIVPLYNFVE